MNSQGKAYEAMAMRWLQAHKIKLIKQNFSCRYGEIDLIAHTKEILLFIEVRYRCHEYFGGAIASISPQKQQRIRLTASLFLKQHPEWESWLCRYDVIAMSHRKIDWIKGAF